MRFDSKNASVVTAYTNAIKGLNEEQARYVLTKRYVSEADQADLLVKAQIISATEGVKASELSRQLVLQGLRKEQADALIEQISGNEAITSNTILTKEQTAAILEQAEARKLLSAEQRQNIANDIEESASSAAEATAEMAQASSELAESTAKVGTTSSILARGVSQLGTGMKSLLSIFVSSPTAIIATLAGSIIGLTYIIGKFQDSAKNAAKAASDFASSMTSVNSTYNQEAQTLNELTEKYQDLREQLIAAKGNEEETYSIKSQMLELQKQLNEIYGDEYDKVNLVTDAYRDQTDELRKNAKQKAENYLNENYDKIEEAKDKLFSERTYELGNFNYGLQDANLGNELHRQIKQLAKDSGIEWDDRKGFVFKGTAEDASKAINQLMTDVTNLKNAQSNLPDSIEENLSAFSSSMSKQLGYADEIIKGYQETYETAQMAQIASDTNLSKEYNQAIDAVEKYNDAVLRSENPYDDENVKKAWDNLQTIKNGIKENEAEWGQYSNIMDNVFSTASDDAYSFYQTMQNDDSISKLTDDLQGLSDTDLQSMADDGVEDSFDKLCQKANEYGLEVQDVIDLLLQLGVAQGKVEESAPDETDIPSIIDSWNSLIDTDVEELKNTRKDLLALAEAGQLTEETFHDTAGADTFLDRISESLPEAIEWINQLVSSSTQLQSMSSQISKMSDMLADKKNGTTASASDLAGFDATIKGLESWDEFERVMGSSKSSMEECQQAANALATEWVNNGNFLSNLTDENKDYYITQLNNMGIENAEAIVTDALAQKKNDLALATQFAEEKSKDLSEATVDEITKFADEHKMAGEARNALYRLALAKKGVSAATLTFDGDITNIKNFVESISGAAYALTTMETIKKNPGAYVPSEVKQKILEQARTEVSNAVNTPVEVDVDISPTGSSTYKAPSSGSKQKDSKQTVDWISRLLDVLQKKIDATKAKFDNLFTLKDKKNNLAKQLSLTKNLLTATEKSADRYKKAASKVKLSDDLKKKVRNGSYDINDYDSDTADAINKYKDYYDQYLSLLQQEETLKKDIRDIEIESLQLNVDNAEAKIARSQALAALDEGNYKKQNKHLESQKKSLRESYNWQIKIAKKKGDSLEVSRLQAEKEKELRDLTKEEFDNIVQTYEYRIGHIDNFIDDLSNSISDVENRGLIADSTFYTAQIDVHNKIKAQQEAELKDLKEQLKTIDELTPEWYQALESIQDVENSITSTNSAIKELQNSINEVANTLSGNVIDSFHDINDEADLLITLLGDNLADSEIGTLTDKGKAALGLYNQQMNVSKVTANNLLDEINSIQNAINNGTYGDFVDSNGMLRQFASTYEAENRIKELYSTYRSEIQSTYQYESKIIDLMKSKYDAELAYVKELIDKKTELLNTEKDLYDYSKNIKSQVDGITSLQKQIQALSGDLSNENTARIQRLEKQLKDQQSELRDTEYDRYVSDQQNMLDNLYSEYEKLVTSLEKDNDTLLKEGNQLIESNGSLIQETIKDTASNYGYQMTEAMTSSVSNITEGLSGIKTVLDGIAEHVAAQIVDDENKPHDINAGGAKNDAISTILSNGDSTKPGSTLTRAVAEAYGGGLSLQEIADISRLLGLKYELKDFEKESPIHNQAKVDVLNELVNRGYLKKSGNKYLKGYAKGGVISSLSDAIRVNGDKVLLSANPGERILTAEQNENWEKWTKALPNLVNLTDVIKPNVNIPTVADRNTGGVTYGGNNQINIELPNVTNYEDFMRKFQSDPKAEQLVQHMTASVLTNNGSRLGKYSVKF